MRKYKQLTGEYRIEIYAMKQAGKKQNEIVSQLSVNPSTISRELQRNTGLRGYRPNRLMRRLYIKYQRLDSSVCDQGK